MRDTEEPAPLAEALNKAWFEHRAGVEISPEMQFSEDGLTLGARTVLAPAVSDEGRVSLDGLEARLASLLACAHLRGPTPGELAHLRAAVSSWNKGGAALAAMHLALSRLNKLKAPEQDAQRLFLGDRLLQAGLSPAELLSATGLPGHPDTIGKYDRDEPRVPPGNGRPSGQWTDGQWTGEVPRDHEATAPSRGVVPRPRRGAGGAPHSRLPRPSAPASSSAQASLAPEQRAAPMMARVAAGGTVDLGGLGAAEAGQLGLFLSGLAAAVGISAEALAASGFLGLGLALIPGPPPTGKWVDLGGKGQISYFVSPTVPGITFRYTTADGVQREVKGVPAPGGNYKDPRDGRVIARWIRVARRAVLLISTAALLRASGDEPRLCPAPSPDNHGDRGVAYEDFMKARLNPGNPTPSRMGYAFANPEGGRPVKFDDCQQRTGNLAEYKGPGYEDHLLRDNVVGQMQLWRIVWQAERQLAASHGRRLTWYFAEERAYRIVKPILRKLFPQIRVVYAPMGMPAK